MCAGANRNIRSHHNGGVHALRKHRLWMQLGYHACRRRAWMLDNYDRPATRVREIPGDQQTTGMSGVSECDSLAAGDEGQGVGPRFFERCDAADFAIPFPFPGRIQPLSEFSDKHQTSMTSDLPYSDSVM